VVGDCLSGTDGRRLLAANRLQQRVGKKSSGVDAAAERWYADAGCGTTTEEEGNAQ